VRKLTGHLVIGGGITWQYFGDSPADDEEGVVVGFPLVVHAARRDALRMVQTALQENKIEWLLLTGDRWFLQLDLLRQEISILNDLDYLQGRIELIPEVEHYDEQVFDRVQKRTWVRFVASRDDIERAKPMKIFLSHKGTDKPLVREFRDTLRLLGFDPWLDEDQLVAGTNVDRGILQGFKDSCAAVFFITPAFRDEQYLAGEIELALREKREKGERFAIITLLFEDEAGQKGAVPELLKRYIWKQPHSHLEALREILRGLPVEVGPVKWRG
jgi:hypothetical protein